jgi:hypothetical protein
VIPSTLSEIIVDLYRRIEEHARRFENRERTGTIHEVDAKKGLARVKIGETKDGKPVLSPWSPWKEVAMGAIKTHFPPAVGEQVKLLSESGDLTDAVIDTSLPSNANKRPHDKEGEAKIQIGETYILMTGDSIEISTGHLKQVAGRIDHDQRGGGGASGVALA